MNDIVKPEATSTDLIIPTDNSWGAGMNLGLDDIQIPYVLLMQGLSEFLKDKALNARLGEYRDSTTGDFLGDNDRPLEVITFGDYKEWRIVTNDKQKKFLRREPFTIDNADAPWEFSENGKECLRVKVTNFYLLRIAPDLDITKQLPYVMSFSSTSQRCARQWGTLLSRLHAQNKNSASVTFVLTSEESTNDLGTYYSPAVRVGRTSTNDEQKVAYKWYRDVIQLGTKKVVPVEPEIRKDERQAGDYF